jgi:hypothetical protein
MTAIKRSDFRDAVETLLEAQRAATPTLLRKTARFTPGGLGREAHRVGWRSLSDDLATTPARGLRVMTERGAGRHTYPTDTLTDGLRRCSRTTSIERFTSNYGHHPEHGHSSSSNRIDLVGCRRHVGIGSSVIYRGMPSPSDCASGRVAI